MSYLISRAKGLFQYGDLSGESRVSMDGRSVDIEETGILSANARVRKSRRCIWMGTIATLLLAVIIISAAVKNRHHIQAAAKALMDSVHNANKDDLEVGGEAVSSARAAGNKFTFDNFVRNRYYPGRFNGTWISDTEILYRDSNYGISINNVATSETQTVVSHNQAMQLHFQDYSFSADRSYMLVKTSSIRVWRRSSFGSYAIVRMVDGRPTSDAIPLEPPHADHGGDDFKQYLRYVSWAPTGNAIAYVDYENNVHYRHSAEAEDIRLTSSGKEDVVFNGIPDWVNEEEVFEDNKALYWSPSGSKLVYGTFNDTLVDIVKLPRYGSWKKDQTDRQGYPFLQYFLYDDFRYPKVGSTNPMITLWMADVGPPGSSNPIRQQNLPPPLSLMGAEYHYTFVRWASNDTVAVNWMNRIQNMTAINLCDTIGDVSCKEVFVHKESNGWVDYKFDVVFNKYRPMNRFLTILGSTTNPNYRQLLLVDVDNNQRTLMTRKNSEVTKILKWTREDHVYYVGTREDEPGSRHLYRLELGQPEPDCLTCQHNEVMTNLGHREKCDFVDIKMSDDGAYYVMDCKGPGIPYSCLHHTSTNTLLSVWMDNKNLENSYSLLDTSTVKYMKVPIPGTGQSANVIMHLPSTIFSNPGKKYPMLVDVYGGPGFQTVDKKWAGYGFGAYMSSSEEVVYVRIDGRGSGFQGNAWRHAVYRNFGSAETSDTIYVTKYLQDNLNYVDRDRTAIWGWSYGGFLSLSVLTQDTDNVFSCGASVAPVVRWELYDTYYTERYMSTVDDNPDGYNTSTPLTNLENLRHKKYLVMHGTHDDNVHYQQSMLLAAALEEKDILFRQQTYPDQDHGIGDYTKHLYHTLSNFLLEECFNSI